jgi:hypothetical protein
MKVAACLPITSALGLSVFTLPIAADSDVFAYDISHKLIWARKARSFSLQQQTFDLKWARLCVGTGGNVRKDTRINKANSRDAACWLDHAESPWRQNTGTQEDCYEASIKFLARCWAPSLPICLDHPLID